MPELTEFELLDDVKVEEVNNPIYTQERSRWRKVYSIIRDADMDKTYMVTLPVKVQWTKMANSIHQTFRKARVPYKVMLRKTEYGPKQNKFYFQKIKRLKGVSAATDRNKEVVSGTNNI